MLDNLTNRLARVMKTLKGEARLTESNISDALREVRMALLEADVALPVVKDFIAAVKEKAVGEEVIGSLSPGQALVGVVHRELTELMGGAASVWSYTGASPKGTGNRGFRLVATAEYYACGEGWIALGANHQHQIEILFAVLGAPEMIHDPRFATHAARVENYAALKGWLVEQLLAREAGELADALAKAGVPIIFHSGHYQQDVMQRRYPGAFSCGKPCSPSELVTVLQQVVR